MLLIIAHDENPICTPVRPDRVLGVGSDLLRTLVHRVARRSHNKKALPKRGTVMLGSVNLSLVCGESQPRVVSFVDPGRTHVPRFGVVLTARHRR